MSVFSELMQDMGGQWAQGFRRSVEDEAAAQDQIRRQKQAFQVLQPLQEAAERKKMQYASDLAMRNQSMLEWLKQQRTNPKAQAQEALARTIETPPTVNVEWGSEFGSEEPTQTGMTSITKPHDPIKLAAAYARAGQSPNPNVLKLLTQGGKDTEEEKAANFQLVTRPDGTVVRVHKLTNAAEPVPGLGQADKSTDYQYITRPDGSVIRVHKATNVAEPVSGAEPLKTPQAFTETSIAGMLSGAVPLPPGVTRDMVLKARDEFITMQGAKTGARSDASIESRLKNIEGLAKFTEAMTGARKKVGLAYLPYEVRARAQEMINVTTDPANVEKSAQKIQQEEIARGNGQRLPENDKQSLALLNTTRGAIDELKRQFSPEERRSFVGWIQNPSLRLQQMASGALGMEADKKFAAFQAIMGRIKKSAFDDGGKQLTPFEFSVVAQYIPQGTEASWEDFEAKLEVASHYTEMLIDARVKYATVTRGEIQKSGLPKIGYGGSQNQPQGNPSTTPSLKQLREKYGY